MDCGYTTDPFLVTADWLRSVLAVWHRDDCVLCGKSLQIGEGVRWLYPDYPGAGTRYRVVDAGCDVQNLWPRSRPVGRRR